MHLMPENRFKAFPITCLLALVFALLMPTTSIFAQNGLGLTLGDPASKCNRQGMRPCWLILEEERTEVGEKEMECTLKGEFSQIIGAYVVYSRRLTPEEFAAWGSCLTGSDYAYSTSQCCRDFAKMWGETNVKLRDHNMAESVAYGCSVSEYELKRGGIPNAFSQDPQSRCYTECLGSVGLSDGMVFGACLDGCATYALNFNSRAIIDRLSSCTAGTH